MEVSGGEIGREHGWDEGYADWAFERDSSFESANGSEGCDFSADESGNGSDWSASSGLSSSTGDASGVDRRLVFSNNCGRIWMEGVTIRNKGVDWGASSSNVYWKHDVKRHEALRIVLHGRSEFDARDVVIEGDRLFDVPDRCRMEARAGANGEVITTLICVGGGAPTWHWRYALEENGAIRAEVVDSEDDTDDY